MFDQVVFAGGGGRCAWQLGFWDTVAPALRLQPRVISAVSAGALMASLLLMQDTPAVMAWFRQAFAANRKNAYWGNLWRSEPVFPHYRMYREAMLHLFHGRLARLQAGSELRIGVTVPPKALPGALAFPVGALAYQADKRLLGRLHPQVALRLGYRLEFHRAQDCRSEEELADLILCSSCTPPFTPPLHFRGRAILDGGVVDNVPVAGLDAVPGTALVLLTRRYPEWPRRFQRHQGPLTLTYVQPSQTPPLKVWDYTSPERGDETFALGQADGRWFLEAESPHRP